MSWLDQIQGFFTRNEPQPQPTPAQAAIQQAMGVSGPVMGPPAPAKKAAPKKAAPKPKPKAPKVPVPAPPTGPQNLTQPVIQTPASPQAVVAEMQRNGLQVPDIVNGPGYHSTIEGTGTQEDVNGTKNVTQDQLVNSSGQDTKNQEINTGRTMQILGDPEFQRATSEERQLQLRSMRDQDEGLRQIRAGVNSYKGITPQLDLSPLAALVDSQTGSKFSQSYKVPDAARRLAAENVAADSGVQKLQNEYTKDQLALLRAQIAGYDQKQLLTALATNSAVKDLSGQTNTTSQTMKDAQTGKVTSSNMPLRDHGAGKPQINNEMEKLWSTFEPQARPFLAGIAAIPTTMALVNQNSPVSSQSAVRQILHVSGDNRPSDADVRAYAKGNTELAERMNQALDAAFEGKAWTPRNQKEIREVLKAFANGARENFQRKIKGFAASARMYQPTLSLSNSQIEQALMARAGLGQADLAPPVEKPKKSLMEEYMEFKKAQGGK